MMDSSKFYDREEAGRALASHLREYANRDDVIVLALPRGGVPVAYEVALALHAPLDVFLVRKLGVPGHEELAMGAIASGGVELLNESVVRMLGISEREVEAVARAERAELERRAREYRDDRPPLDLRRRCVIIVDDGLATGATMRAAVAALRMEGPSRIIVAVPVGATETCDALGTVADDVVCVRTPEPFNAVGLWYQKFDQTSDDEVRELLHRARTAAHRARPV
jgi:predicted phosphoribosyltransferase